MRLRDREVGRRGDSEGWEIGALGGDDGVDEMKGSGHGGGGVVIVRKGIESVNEICLGILSGKVISSDVDADDGGTCRL